MNPVAIGAIVFKLIPVITNAIKTVEELGVELKDPNANKSALKLAAAKQIIQGIYESANPTVPFDDLVAPIEKIIAATVSFYNSFGVFKKAFQK